MRLRARVGAVLYPFCTPFRDTPSRTKKLRPGWTARAAEHRKGAWNEGPERRAVALRKFADVALAASALAELRHGNRNTGIETLKRLLRSG